ncbi:MAG: PHB depolymerase family esterase, partial [Candidatus Sulfotelmatobacter sp.]
MTKLTANCLGVLLLTHVVFAQESREKVQVDDVERTYVARLPKGYSSQQRYPVVILLHAMNQDAGDMERLTQFDNVADKNGVIAIYPNALHGRWNIGVRPELNDAMARRGGWPGSTGGGSPGSGYPGGGDWPGGGYPGGGGGYPGGGRPG